MYRSVGKNKRHVMFKHKVSLCSCADNAFYILCSGWLSNVIATILTPTDFSQVAYTTNKQIDLLPPHLKLLKKSIVIEVEFEAIGTSTAWWNLL